VTVFAICSPTLSILSLIGEDVKPKLAWPDFYVFRQAMHSHISRWSGKNEDRTVSTALNSDMRGQASD
jgi:hypothetical protein